MNGKVWNVVLGFVTENSGSKEFDWYIFEKEVSEVGNENILNDLRAEKKDKFCRIRKIFGWRHRSIMPFGKVIFVSKSWSENEPAQSSFSVVW